ncbi:hypothetical protein [Albimonas pacifica]|uniref:Uncharacterized protein n=1 Tax=Albimonas pacifica TaxID=1114924 RepID=A0A1I3JWF1_9RHOB|nr:hypothetical protein [Albimonas pacifica]SFI64410.1 hypothetical protein SAMN05216258_108182 [Albimonas pacifica]
MAADRLLRRRRLGAGGQGGGRPSVPAARVAGLSPLAWALGAALLAGVLAANVQLYLISGEEAAPAPERTFDVLAQAASPAVAEAMRALSDTIAGRGSQTPEEDLEPLRAHLAAAAYCYDQGLCAREPILAHACGPLDGYEAVMAELMAVRGARYDAAGRALTRTMLWKDCEAGAPE